MLQEVKGLAPVHIVAGARAHAKGWFVRVRAIQWRAIVLNSSAALAAKFALVWFNVSHIPRTEHRFS